MTLDLPHLRDLESKATPAPWREHERCFMAKPDEACGIASDFVPPGHGGARNIVRSDASDECSHVMQTADVQLIVEVRNALPALLAQLTKLRVLAEAVRHWADSDEAMREMPLRCQDEVLEALAEVEEYAHGNTDAARGYGEFARDDVRALLAQVDQLKAALREACDISSNAALFPCASIEGSSRIAELRKLTE